ncbi:MAG: hypothetical protein LBP31_02245 [Holosporales bacterium]|jgi:hypothetical protein|nr:hypothetical protein [Holosporales bacterium]
MRFVLQKLIVAVITVFSTTCYASFFMNEEESKKMREFVDKVKKSQKHSQNAQSLDVSGIMYVDELHWTIWINGVPYYQAGQYDGFSIDVVTENEVTITKQDGTTITMEVSSDCREDNNEKPSSKNEAAE